ILDFIDDKNLLVLQIQCSTSRGNEHRRLSLYSGFGRNIAIVGVIPNSYEGFTKVTRYLHASCFHGSNEFLARWIDCETFCRINASLRTCDYRPRCYVALVCSIENENALGIAITDGDDVIDGVDGNSPRAIDLRLRSSNHSQWSHITVSQS